MLYLFIILVVNSSFSLTNRLFTFILVTSIIFLITLLTTGITIGSITSLLDVSNISAFIFTSFTNTCTFWITFSNICVWLFVIPCSMLDTSLTLEIVTINVLLLDISIFKSFILISKLDAYVLLVVSIINNFSVLVNEFKFTPETCNWVEVSYNSISLESTTASSRTTDTLFLENSNVSAFVFVILDIIFDTLLSGRLEFILVITSPKLSVVTFTTTPEAV